jgi:hypothetical protein
MKPQLTPTLWSTRAHIVHIVLNLVIMNFELESARQQTPAQQARKQWYRRIDSQFLGRQLLGPLGLWASPRNFISSDQDFLNGFPRFTSFMMSDPDHVASIYRRFDALNTRNLLLLESRVAALEALQEKLDQQDLEQFDLHPERFALTTTAASYEYFAVLGSPANSDIPSCAFRQWKADRAGDMGRWNRDELTRWLRERYPEWNRDQVEELIRESNPEWNRDELTRWLCERYPEWNRDQVEEWIRERHPEWNRDQPELPEEWIRRRHPDWNRDQVEEWIRERHPEWNRDQVEEWIRRRHPEWNRDQAEEWIRERHQDPPLIEMPLDYYGDRWQVAMAIQKALKEYRT